MPIVVTSIRAKPLKLYHFFSSDCPCSRFVQPQVSQIEKQFAGQLKVTWVGQAGAPLNLDTSQHTYYQDRKGALARYLGVYCTPIAVLTDSSGNVLYRGPYNKARFCSAHSTAYVEQALSQYLRTGRVFSQSSVPVFGCLLPSVENAHIN
jgi:predicted lipoprotein